MDNMFYKKISISKNLPSTYFIKIHGKLMGWTDGENLIDCTDVKKTIEENFKKNGPESVANFMRGVVGPCVIEIVNNNDIWFFASCASGGFYWISTDESDDLEKSFIVSNYEGKFLRKAFQIEGRITDGALMNAVLSHQSVIRPLFDGLVFNSKRCPPGFYTKFSWHETKIKTYLLSKQKETRKQQDAIIKKKMEAINSVYKKYCKITGAIAKLSFSGGVDSTALLINHKNTLDKTFQGFYIDRGKLSEVKMAVEIANRSQCKIDFIEPYESFSIADIKKKAETGLSIMNGLVYMKHAFSSYPYKHYNDKIEKIILTGQNSDTLFHIDTFAASSFSKGIIRLVTMFKGIIGRYKTTIMYYNLYRLLKQNKRFQIIPQGIKKTYTSLSEHNTGKSSLPDGVIKIIKEYKEDQYVSPFVNWVLKESNLKIKNSIFGIGERDNHIARLARWLRTVGNFHQQFINTSYNENITICTPYSEGPMAVELLSYKLSLRDVFFPKSFLHKFIKNKLNISYSEIRKIVLNDRLIYFPQEIIFYGYKYIIKKIKKFLNKYYYNADMPFEAQDNISQEDLFKLRELLGHKNGIVDRFLLNNVDDIACKKYLNYLYDCIELKVTPKKINNVVGMQLCRLVNLQIMLNKKN